MKVHLRAFDRDDPSESRVARTVNLAHAATADPGFQAVRTELRAFQVVVRQLGTRRNARRLEKIAGAFVCVQQRRGVCTQSLVSDAGLHDEAAALPDRQSDSPFENIPHTPPLVGTK